MTVAFDARTGRLRLDQKTFDCLVAWARGTADPGPELGELRDAGAIRSGAPHPAVWPGLQAVTEPVCRLHLASIDDDGRCRSGDGWIASNAAALLLDAPDSMRELITVHPTFLPMAIARIVRLGPHPRPGTDPLHIPRVVYEGLFAPDRAERRLAAERISAGASDEPPLRDVVEQLVTGPWRLWAVTLTWTTPDGEPAAHAMQVAGTLAGLCLVDTGGQDSTLWPTTATGVWRRLTLLLPDEVRTP
jgi:hypothetical protein